MKKFAEYITEGAPAGKKPKEVLDDEKSKIAEERLRLIDEAVIAKIGPEGSGPPKSGKPTRGPGPLSRIRRSVSTRLGNLKMRARGFVGTKSGYIQARKSGMMTKAQGQQFKIGRKYRQGLIRQAATNVTQNLAKGVYNRSVGSMKRRLDRAFDPYGVKSGTRRETQGFSSMEMNKLQSGSIGSRGAEAERKRKELGL